MLSLQQVGTGFSFTNDTAGYSTNETEVATNLYSALTQFFTVYTDYVDSDFYVTGEVNMYSMYVCVCVCV